MRKSQVRHDAAYKSQMSCDMPLSQHVFSSGGCAQSVRLCVAEEHLISTIKSLSMCELMFAISHRTVSATLLSEE